MKKVLAFVVATLIMVSMFAGVSAVAESPLAGKSVTLSILGIGGWKPSSLAQEMGSELFAKYAKEKYGYDVNVTFAEAPFDSLFQKAAHVFGC